MEVQVLTPRIVGLGSFWEIRASRSPEAATQSCSLRLGTVKGRMRGAKGVCAFGWDPAVPVVSPTWAPVLS